MKTRGSIIEKIIEEAPDVKTFFLRLCRDAKLSFSSGQYVNILNRCYSISSSPEDRNISITVKKAGEISSKLHSLKIGDKVGISGPFGFFTLDNLKLKKDIVFIAGGIGITPIRSMIKHLFEQKADRNIQLFYSNKKAEDIVFRREFDELAGKWKDFRVFYTLTQEKKRIAGIKGKGRLNGTKIKKYSGGLKNKYCFLCGSIDFVNSLWEDLKKVGVKEEFIKTETFY